jgi:hypothetical protein
MSQRPIEKAGGFTEAERYLRALCERTFLSMWSYPSVFRDQGRENCGDGKEVCDLLVVFDNDILIFSDKHCKFASEGDLKVNWCRWYKAAVRDSVKQIWGAERWIKSFPDRLFLDRKCTQPLPVNLPPIEQARFHRIIVAHEASLRCREKFGGSGSLMMIPDIIGPAHYSDSEMQVMPFAVGQVDPQKGFVHVLDDTSLAILMTELDTISDFVGYLDKNERFIKASRLGFAAGEEELLAEYLKKVNADGEHDFIFDGDDARIGLIEGFWEDFRTSPQRAAQKKANEISYCWDALIERFSHNAMMGTQYRSSIGGFSGTERSLRFLAREKRTRRRILAESLIGMINAYPGRMIATRVVPPGTPATRTMFSYCSRISLVWPMTITGEIAMTCFRLCA